MSIRVGRFGRFADKSHGIRLSTRVHLRNHAAKFRAEFTVVRINF